jgi:hypothetical protein
MPEHSPAPAAPAHDGADGADGADGSAPVGSAQTLLARYLIAGGAAAASVATIADAYAIPRLRYDGHHLAVLLGYTAVTAAWAPLCVIAAVRLPRNGRHRRMLIPAAVAIASILLLTPGVLWSAHIPWYRALIVSAALAIVLQCTVAGMLQRHRSGTRAEPHAPPPLPPPAPATPEPPRTQPVGTQPPVLRPAQPPPEELGRASTS